MSRGFGDGFDDSDIFGNWDPYEPLDLFPMDELQPAIRHKRSDSVPIAPPFFPTASPPVTHLPSANTLWNFGARPNSRSSRKSFSDCSSADERQFFAFCADQSLRFNPKKLGFIPETAWEDKEITFTEIVTDFFRRKNNANSRFSHKLFNALQLSEYDPVVYRNLVGVSWMNENILRVDKIAFAKLLGIKSVDGSFFHQQGNFPSHGFFEIGKGDVARYCPPDLDLTDVDFEDVRILIHMEGRFKRGCSESDIGNCRWMSSKK